VHGTSTRNRRTLPPPPPPPPPPHPYAVRKRMRCYVPPLSRCVGLARTRCLESSAGWRSG